MAIENNPFHQLNECSFRTHANFEENKDKSAAATNIQSLWRGHLARAKLEGEKGILSYRLFEKGKSYITNPSSIENMPRAAAGKTPVYLSPEFPLVLKQSGSPENQKRIAQMQDARNLCQKNHYHLLEVPPARSYKNFVIERKLPIGMHDMKVQIGLYIEHQERFTEVIKEFTGFLCQSDLSDITGGAPGITYSVLFTTPIGRYDNLPLFIEKDQGKIGLIDLEGFSLGNCFPLSACEELVLLFPYHLETILSIARQFDPEIDVYRNKLELVIDEVLCGFKLIYGNHLDFIKRNGISLENPFKIVEISENRQECIKEAVISMLREEAIFAKRCDDDRRLREESRQKPEDDFGEKPESCFGEEYEKCLTLFSNSFPQTLQLITSFLEETVKYKTQGKGISSYHQLLACRTLHDQSTSDHYWKIDRPVSLQMKKSGMLQNDVFRELRSKIIQGVFAELAKGGEIAYHNPNLGVGNYAKPCIFF